MCVCVCVCVHVLYYFHINCWDYNPEPHEKISKTACFVRIVPWQNEKIIVYTMAELCELIERLGVVSAQIVAAQVHVRNWGGWLRVNVVHTDI